MGHNVLVHADARANPHALLVSPPDAFVIDLARLPSQGRELGGVLRRAPATRNVPLVYIEGAPEKTASVRSLLPDATHTTWDRIDSDLRRALAVPAGAPVVPGAIDAYARVPLAKKLGVRPSSNLVLLDAPRGFEEILGALPDSVCPSDGASGSGDVVLWFAENSEALDTGYTRAAACVREGGRLWILWRKRGRRSADLTQNQVRAAGLRHGWVDYRISAMDAEWSGLCLARRRPPESKKA